MEENRRYRRQIAIDGIGETGQRKLREATVAVIGCGALGTVAAMYLAGAGVGKLILADFDTVDISNLQRQLFYSEAEAGKKKVHLLAGKVKSLNSEVEVTALELMVTPRNAPELLKGADFVIDATDNPASKYAVDAICDQLALPCTIGGVESMRGQLITILPGDDRYRDLFPDMPANPGLTPCSVAGVLGPAAGIVASLQAAEAIKYIVGQPLLRQKLLDFDLSRPAFALYDF